MKVILLIFFITNAHASRVDSTHKYISEKISSIAESIDSLFGTARADEEANNSRIRISQRVRFVEADVPSKDLDFNIQLKLPKTENRFKLIIEGNDDKEDEDNVINNNITNSQTKTNEEATQNPTQAAIRFMEEHAGIKTSYDLGAKLQIPVSLFARIRLRKNIELSPRSLLRPVIKLKWDYLDGYDAYLAVDYDHKINNTWQFRFRNFIEWESETGVYDFNQGPIFFQRIAEDTAISYEAIAHTFADHNDSYLEGYYVSINFRSKLYYEWLYFNTGPGLNFTRNNNFQRDPFYTIRVDAIFGKI